MVVFVLAGVFFLKSVLYAVLLLADELNIWTVPLKT